MNSNIMDNNIRNVRFPSLPIEEWEDTKDTLHLFMQIVGKIRLGLFPKKNHWWHVPFYVSTRGLTTGPIPYKNFIFEMEFDFREHVLRIDSSSGDSRNIELEGLSVARFYKAVFSGLSEFGIETSILAVPYDAPDVSTEPFETDEKHAAYDREYVKRYWQILLQVDSIFQVFRGQFIGKCSPAHVFWHHGDLALTLFSGRPARVREGAGPVEREAYSHEVISFGFWAGDKNVREPAFYAYAAPQPEGLMEEPLRPKEAFWNPEAGMALLMYNSIREAESPGQKVLDFLESVYLAGAKRANWDIEAFRLPSYEKQPEKSSGAIPAH
ncbi:hypothetical protein MSMTP_1716 [Methanosarcina sp. MTP4]|uniref:DUF5996 family protein n=1 Tax=Methanosarcina sp. MTP4 TaxID=1434100 RepID=UPI000615704B|nr:DUF5996 family protein [Methanosarcina sp. MTP4]AKB25185.1 hypothetical protein MSMTP_1716 [Methanosarcina sp. MTP4]